MDHDDESDRYRNLSEAEQRIAAMRRDGFDVVDRQGRPRTMLGSGPQSRLVRASVPVQQSRPKHSSDAITGDEFRRMYEAVATANIKRLLLNTFVTISWGVGGIRDHGYVDTLHKRFLASMRAWALYKGEERDPISHACIWVKEVGKVLGLHSHFLVHVPGSHYIDFMSWVQGAAHQLCELPPRDHRRPRPKEQLAQSAFLGDDPREQWKLFNYLMKGIDPEAVTKLRSTTYLDLLLKEFDRKATPQGIVVGARVGRSGSLGPKDLAAAELQWGKAHIWPAKHDPDELHFDGYWLHHGELRSQLRR